MVSVVCAAALEDRLVDLHFVEYSPSLEIYGLCISLVYIEIVLKNKPLMVVKFLNNCIFLQVSFLPVW